MQPTVTAGISCQTLCDDERLLMVGNPLFTDEELPTISDQVTLDSQQIHGPEKSARQLIEAVGLDQEYVVAAEQ